MTTRPSCPECVNGKHINCTRLALDLVTDDFVACACPTCHPQPAQEGAP